VKTRSRLPITLGGAALSLALAGCLVGPEYRSPAPTTPTHWSQATGVGTNGGANLARWWTTFHDPELDSLIRRGVSSNLDLRVAAIRVREARAARGIAASALWPTADASGSYARERVSRNGLTPAPANASPEHNLYQAGFDAAWELDLFGGARRAVEAASADLAAAEFARENALVTLLAEVARNYVEARGFQRQLAIAAANLQAQQDALDVTRARFNGGLTGELDVTQAAALLATTSAAMPPLESSLQASIHHLGTLLGQAPSALTGELVAAAPIPSAPPEVPLGLPSDLLRRRPDIRVAERQLAAANARIGVATADLFPKFSLTGAAGLSSVSASDWFTGGSQFWSLGPTVQWRLFDAGRIRANIRLQSALQEEALTNYEKTVLGAMEEVENALIAYAKERAHYQALAAAEAANRRSLELASELYANGLTGYLNVLDAQRSLYQASDQLVQSERAVSVNVIALYKALGGGWEVPTASPLTQK